MKKRLFLGFATAVICVVVLMLLLRQRSGDCYYQGKALETWSREALINDQAGTALKAMGICAVPRLLELLRAQDSPVRKRSWSLVANLPRKWQATAWQKMGPPNAVTTREAAARALGIIGPAAKAAIPNLADALRDPEGRVGWEACTALGRIGKESVPALIQALQASDLKVRQMAACALGEIGPDAQAAVPGLILTLPGPSDELRVSITYSLGKIGTPALAALTNVIANGDAKGREAAAKELLRTCSSLRTAVPALLQMARDDAPAARRQAIETLGAFRIANDATMTVYTNALKDQNADVRLAAIKAVGQTGWRVSSAAPELLRMAEDPEASVRSAARDVLARLAQ